MTWLSQGIIDDLGAAAAAHELAAEKAGDALETHRKAALAARDELHRHQGLAAEAKFLLTIAHGAAPVPPPGRIREVDDQSDGLGLAIGDLRMALPQEASPEQFGLLAESMRALYAAAHVVALHADDRARMPSSKPPPVPVPEGPAPVPRAVASLVGDRVRVEGADGTSHVGVLGSVEGGQITLLDRDGVPFAWPLLTDVVSIRTVPPAENGGALPPPPGTAVPNGAQPQEGTPQEETWPREGARPREGAPPPTGPVSLVRRDRRPGRAPEVTR